MTTNRAEYQKEYSKKHYEKLRKYRTDWQFKKRHGGLTQEEWAIGKVSSEVSLDKVEIPINPNARKNCCLCLKPINQRLYEKNGNYCLKCQKACQYLSDLYETEAYEIESDKFIKTLPITAVIE